MLTDCLGYGIDGDVNCTDRVRFANGTCVGNRTTGKGIGIWNEALAANHSISWNSSTKEYFRWVKNHEEKLNLWNPFIFKRQCSFCNYRLMIEGATEAFEDVGGLKWRTAAALVGVWLLLACFLYSGIKSLAKV